MRTFFPLGGRGRLRRGRGWLLGSAVVALAASGIAFAGPGPASMSLASATFYTTTMAQNHAQSCTAANNDAIQVLDATFTGSASSADPRLTGPLTVHVKSVYDSTTNVGSLKGDLRIDNTSTTPPSHIHARLTAVNVNGTVQGFVDGNLGGGTHLLGSFTGTFSSATGFSSSAAPATLGSGGGTNTALLTTGGCTPVKAPKPGPPHPAPPKPDKPDNHHHH